MNLKETQEEIVYSLKYSFYFIMNNNVYNKIDNCEILRSINSDEIKIIYTKEPFTFEFYYVPATSEPYLTIDVFEFEIFTWDTEYGLITSDEDFEDMWDDIYRAVIDFEQEVMQIENREADKALEKKNEARKAKKHNMKEAHKSWKKWKEDKNEEI